MPYILCILLLLQTLSLTAQCKDVYGSSTECPTSEDSLVIYNNAIRVTQFYTNNPAYKLTNSREVTTESEKKEVFEDLREARRLFNILRRELKNMKDDKFSAGQPSPKYKDINYSQYYSEVDETRFYQRELENQIINAEAPMSMYDLRISPIYVNSYTCIDSSSVYFNDLVNIPLYVPVVVKPFALLTEDELLVREKVLHIVPKIKPPKREVEKRTETNTIVVRKIVQEKVQDTIVHAPDFFIPKKAELPIYAFNNYGSGGVIGFMVGHKFKKLDRMQYGDYAVPLFARELLENEKELDKYLKLKFGDYYEGFY
jgi:hypothetical protein